MPVSAGAVQNPNRQSKADAQAVNSKRSGRRVKSALTILIGGYQFLALKLRP
jgi:hypothetical protein